MKKRKPFKLTLKTAFIVCAAVCVLGIVMTAVGFFSGASLYLYADAKGVHTGNAAPEYIKKAELPNIQNLNIDISSANIEFVKAEKFALDMCYYDADYHPKFEFSNGTLKLYDERAQTFGMRYFNIDLRNDPPMNYIKIYVPENVKLDTVDIRSQDGYTKLTGFSADTLSLAVAGAITLSDATIKSSSLNSTVEAYRLRGNYREARPFTISLNRINADRMAINGEALDQFVMDNVHVSNMQCTLQSSSSFQVKNSTFERSDWNVSAYDVQMSNVISKGMVFKNPSSSDAISEFSGTFTGITQLEFDGSVVLHTMLGKDAYSWRAAVKRYVPPTEEESEEAVDENDGWYHSSVVDATQNEAYITIDGVKQSQKEMEGGKKGSANQLTVKSKDGNVSLNFSK